jgi:hypothetical protein
LQHEQVNEKTVALYIKGAKLTGRLLAKAMQAALRQMKKAHDAPKVGEQSMKRLTRTSAGTDNIEVMGRIGSFESIARKHRISYHVEREADAEPPKYMVYFNSRQNGALTAAFKEYTALMLHKEKDKPSLLGKLNKFKELLKTIAAPVKSRDRGGHEL